MKRILATVAAVALILSLSACKDDTPSATPSGDKTVPAQSQQVSNQPETQKDTEKKDAPKVEEHEKLQKVYRIGARDIYMNVPNWQKINEGYTEVFMLHGQRYIAVTGHLDSKPSSLTEAHQLAYDKFQQNIQNQSYVNKLNVEKEETSTINGIEVYRYEGTLNCGHDTIYDAYAVGYSFIMDGLACNIIGCVTDKEQPQADIDEVRELVDAMIKTVRSEK